MVDANKPQDAVETALEKLKPILSKLSFGMFAGYTSGYATKKIGKLAAVLVGVGFIFLQSLAAAGYIEIDWLKIQDTAVKKMDTDGDGKVSVADLKEYWRRFRTILTNKMPDGAGFSLGFLYGVKHG